MPSPLRLLPVLCALLLAAACGQDVEPVPDTLPEGLDVATASAEVMAGLDSVYFDVRVDGDLTNYQIKRATGALTAEGDAKASAQLVRGDQTLEAGYVRLNGDTFLSLSTGGYQKLPERAAGQIFDPSVLLAREGGIPGALLAATEASNEGVEEIEGRSTYHLRATIDPRDIDGLEMLVTGSPEPVDLWVDRQTEHLIRARLTFVDPSDNQENTVTVTFSKFDEDANIQSPL